MFFVFLYFSFVCNRHYAVYFSVFIHLFVFYLPFMFLLQIGYPD
ncbi:hypothetical protein HMPREF2738_00707 [Clostridiales bacterium KLE1615]|nr:hypothetical protein HMPREF2738_00707 [Clostridiales bacterium KLE1615]